jgi:hypothetical protein
MTLGEQQRLFMRLLPRLIDYAYANGFELTAGELYRTPEQAALNAKSGAGIAHSLHTQRLAIDVQLFKGGVYLDKSEDYQSLGEFWKRQHPLARWGGDFHSRPDGNHFSLEYGGTQ